MTQGNCGRMAVGTRPDSAARGRTRPPPRPPPPPRRCSPGSAPASPRSPPSLPPQTAAGAFGGTASPRTRGAECGGGREAGKPAGRTAPRPRPTPPPGRPGTAARLGRELCSFPSNYLSEQRAGGRPKQGPALPEGLPVSVRGELWGARGISARVSRPPVLPLPSPLLLPPLSDTTQPGLLLPLPLGSLRCGRTASTVSCPPANSGPRSRAAPAALGAPRAAGPPASDALAPQPSRAL